VECTGYFLLYISYVYMTMQQILCRTDKEICLHMFHVILDMKVTFEIYEREGTLMHSFVVHSVSANPDFLIQSVPLATEPCISLIIISLMRILQRNLKRTYLIV
jgi:hypothetical protein